MQSISQHLRSAVLRHVRLPVSSCSVPEAVGGGLAVFGVRGFAEGLDKAEVTERILNVVKNFEKVDPAKVLTQFYPPTYLRPA